MYTFTPLHLNDNQSDILSSGLYEVHTNILKKVLNRIWKFQNEELYTVCNLGNKQKKKYLTSGYKAHFCSFLGWYIVAI